MDKLGNLSEKSFAEGTTMRNVAMRKVSAVLLSVCALCFLVLGCSDQKSERLGCLAPITELAYDESMGKSESDFRFIFVNSDDASRYAKTKSLYEKNVPSKVAASQNPRIPKIIHQIWLGPNLPPPYFAEFQAKIKALHPDWEYHLWSEAELEELKLENWDIVERSPNWAEKSDIIRCDLLDRFGGVYMDVDMDVRHSLNELHEKYHFYAGMEHPHKIATTNNRVWVGISIMASCPGHPIMKNWKRRIRNGWDEVDLRFSSPIERVINHTYFNFTHAVMQEIDQPGYIDMIFPATYFYPISPSYAAKRRNNGFRAWREKFYDFLERINLKKPRPFSRIYPETIAVHYWGNSWLPGMDTQIKELQRLVDSARKEMYKMQQKLRMMERRMTASEVKVADLLTSRGDKNIVGTETANEELAASL
jgi:mannosyltransferase OCH1-like enzyme